MSITGFAVTVILGLITLVYTDALRRISITEKEKTDAKLCNERHQRIEQRLMEIKQDLGDIFSAIESVRIQLAKMNGGIKIENNN